jgi:hypothetical protein
VAIIYWQDEDTGLSDSLEFRVVTLESHEDAVTVTSHPVETGANVSDHAREEPTRLTLEVFVSNIPDQKDEDADYLLHDIKIPGFSRRERTVPLDIPTPPIQPSATGLVQAGIGALSRAISGQPKATFWEQGPRGTRMSSASLLSQTTPRDRVRDTYEKLLGVFTKKLLVTVQTEMREHFDMMIERAPAKRDPEDGLGATLTLEFIRIRVADSQTVQSPEPAEKRGQAGKSNGSASAKADPNAEPKREKRKTIARELETGD